MPIAALLVLAVGLAMDAAAVSATRGLMVPRVTVKHGVLVAFFFGGAQALMPLLGWLAGDWLGSLVRAWGDWIAAAVFAVLGGKMLWEARKKGAAMAEGGEEPPAIGDPFALGTLALLALATSIDALVAGITLPMMGAPLPLSVATIGVTTAVLSVCALALGRTLGRAFEKRLDIVGGVILVGLGVKVVVTRLLD